MTAHDPRVTLTEVLAAHDDPEGWYCDDNDDLRYQCNCGEMSPALTRATEAIEPRHCAQASDWHRAHLAEVIETTVIAARLDRVRAVAEQWDTGCAREVLAALDAPQDAPRGPVGGEQGAEGAGGRSEGACGLCRPVGPHQAPTLPDTWAMFCGCTFSGTEQVTTHKCCTNPDHQGEEDQR